MYSLKFTDSGHADVRALSKDRRNSLKKALSDLARSPVSRSTELHGPLSGFRSFHWRRYRIVFRIFEAQKVVAVVGIGERDPQSASNIYRRLEALAASGELAESILTTLRGLTSPPPR